MTATATKSRPILFSGPMVRAILEGRKTQTRRVVKPQPTHRLIEGMGHVTKGMDPADDGAVWYDADCINPGREVPCPYGRIGDELWVREQLVPVQESSAQGYSRGVWAYYAADHTPVETGEPYQWALAKSVPSIRMPRWASRITLRITDVRVERVRDITPVDAQAEGVTCPPHEAAKNFWGGHLYAFRDLWDSINGKKHPWASNPWVWVISFERVKEVV